MCLGWLCSCMYNCKVCFNRLLLPLLLIDLALTIYIVVQLASNVPFACCTDPGINDCSYDDIGGADNVELVEPTSGGIFCERKDNPSLNCYSDITSCATNNGIDISQLCSESILDELAKENWTWLLAVLCVKLVGLCFLIFYDITHTWCKGKDTAQEDAESVSKCCHCKCGNNCCKELIFFFLRIFFLIFGTIATCIAVWLLKWTDRVSLSRCDLLEDGLESDCSSLEDACSANAENYYNIVWVNLELSGPYWADLASSILSALIWMVRISVMWYYGRHIAKV